MAISSNSKATRKKKRISKHVLQADVERTKQQIIASSKPDGHQAELKTLQQSRAGAAQKKKRRSGNKHIKDPSEAAMYLKLWQQHKKHGTDWKFNKNTQSWLIRHMYEADKVAKATFGLLLEYLLGLDGDVTKKRIRSDATRRAQRYKEYEKSKEGEAETANGSETKDEESGSSTKATQDADKNPNNDADVDEDDASRWKKLDGHDKRKEYKRARKILDSITT